MGIGSRIIMKPIIECNDEERMKRALYAIEALTYMDWDDAEKLSSEVYMIAHAARSGCKNPHLDWLEKIEEIEEFAKKANFYNVKEVLKNNV